MQSGGSWRMRNKDTKALADAYNLVEESRFKSALAAAAMGLGSLQAHDVDTVNPHSPEDNIVSKPQMIASPEEQETNYHKALTAFEKAKKEKIVDELTLSKIALDEDIAKRYALHLLYQGHRIPDIIKRVIGKSAGEMEHAFSSSTKN
jgi:hypothetical protein